MVGRLAASRLTRRFPASSLLLAAFLLSLASFPLFWLAPVPPLNVVGLFLVGLGFSSLFPLTLSVGVSTAPDQANAASARLTLGGGLAMLSVPLLLGSMADQIGIKTSFGLVMVLLAIATAVTWGVNRLSRRSAQRA